MEVRNCVISGLHLQHQNISKYTEWYGVVLLLYKYIILIMSFGRILIFMLITGEVAETNR
jgi:hypothetical protein